MADSRFASADRALAAAVVLVVFAYAALWPRDLYFFDEGFFLYEASRILRGEVIYRDFFEINAPLAFYVLAGCFKLFGVSFLTGRALMAVLHALTAVLIYASARGLGVRRGLAFVAALAHPALAYTAFPLASPHWFSATLTVALVAMALSPRWQARTLWLGIAVGLLIATQQHKGIVMGAGVGAVILLDAALARWYGGPARRPVPALARYAAGVAVVVVPVFGALLATAGAWPMYDALLRLPLVGYREYHRNQTWGQHLAMPHGDIPARVLMGLPLFFPLSLASALLATTQRRDREMVRARLVLGLLGGFAVLSIAYNPDAVHLAFIAPLALIAAAERLEASLAWLDRRRIGRLASRGIVGALAAGAVFLLGLGLHHRRSWYSIPGDTPLGAIDFADRSEPALLAVLRERLRQEPLREVFGYPFYASLYLLVDAQNPTRFQVLKPGYSSPEHIAEAIEALEARRTPYIVVLPYSVDWNHDEVIRYVGAHYERVPVPGNRPLSGFVLFHRVR